MGLGGLGSRTQNGAAAAVWEKSTFRPLVVVVVLEQVTHRPSSTDGIRFCATVNLAQVGKLNYA